ncbi:MAG: hypothetical protein ACK5ZH_07595, partial [Alphaproteobacteria bacterium]
MVEFKAVHDLLDSHIVEISNFHRNIAKDFLSPGASREISDAVHILTNPVIGMMTMSVPSVPKKLLSAIFKHESLWKQINSKSDSMLSSALETEYPRIDSLRAAAQSMAEYGEFYRNSALRGVR